MQTAECKPAHLEQTEYAQDWHTVPGSPESHQSQAGAGDDTTFRPAWDREPTLPWEPTSAIIRRVMSAPLPGRLGKDPLAVPVASR